MPSASGQCAVCHAAAGGPAVHASNVHGHHVIDPSESFDYYRCANCGALSLGGLPADEAYYRRYYGPGYYQEANVGPCVRAVLSALQRYSYGRKQRFILRSLGTPAGGTGQVRLLDVGCGAGGFLAALDGQRFVGEGVDVNADAVSAARARGLAVQQGDIRDLWLQKRQYDVVTLWHVLEHVPDPLPLLVRVRELVRPGGLVVCAVPNAQSLGARAGGASWFHLDAPRHRFLPTGRSMDWLFRHADLDLLWIRREPYDYPLDLFWSLRNSAWRFLLYPVYPFAKIVAREALTYGARVAPETRGTA